MKKVYLVCLNNISFPMGIFEEKEDAKNFISFKKINGIIEEFCVWRMGQNPCEILNPQTGFTHADYGRKYYGYPEEIEYEVKKEMDKEGGKK